MLGRCLLVAFVFLAVYCLQLLIASICDRYDRLKAGLPPEDLP